MKKNLLLMVFLILLQLQLLKADENLKSIALVDFVQLVSTNNNINIFVDEELKKEGISLFIPNELDPTNLFFLFKNSMQKLGYVVSQYDSIYYLSKNQKELYTYFIKLKYNSFDNVSKYLSFKGIKYQFIDSINSFLVFLESDNINSIKNEINRIDAQLNQVTLKFTIIEFNENDLREQGFTHNSLYTSAAAEQQNVLNSFVLPFQSVKPIFPNTTFYGALKLFEELKLFNINQDPYILVQHGKDFTFTAVTNIPYQSSKTITQASNYSNQTTIEYKDVGLKILGKSLIYDDYVNLDLDLVIEDILNTTDNIPTTYKRQLKSNTNLKFGEVLLLSGIKQTKKQNNSIEVPFFSSIPYLGEVFKYKSLSDIKSNISIAIEVVR
ncbi:hypothetical protein [Sulfurimonas sp.]|uniref:type II secretion system protein GspD n=1 Tax=Sulfurimonas sp. TaxID=2022749 RepID=UPI00260AFECE|nr:hypothetical protein [Sulfurimonas sp.]MDD3855269.1 hypothetical protein [Sulfurimonas sp.]